MAIHFGLQRDPGKLSEGWVESGLLERNEGGETLPARLGVMVLIFCVSLFASSFPTVSQRITYIRIPRIIFFIGKHFGTGVILSTAFVHLLQDAFEALQDPEVKKRWPISGWVGQIVLVSLLFIFLVEYLSTSYVDRLQVNAHVHAHSDPDASSCSSEPCHSPSRNPSTHHDTATCLDDTLVSTQPTERTPLIPPGPAIHRPPSTSNPHTHRPNHHLHHGHTFPRRGRRHSSYVSEGADGFFAGHHKYETPESHESHQPGKSVRRVWVGELVNGEPVQAPSVPGHENSLHQGHPPHHRIRESSRGGSHAHGHAHGHVGHTHGFGDEWGGEETGEERDMEEEEIGEKRQVVGILVLQLGIMLHSLVIGLTLAITSGNEFASLVIAILFHQLFEGLSLGIRIAALPTSTPSHTSDEEDPEASSGSSNPSTSNKPVERGTNPGEEGKEKWWLKPLLALLFAVTTPAGIAIGLGVFGGGKDGVMMHLTQGLMCAISSGMLIYAATVEMLAGDFVMDPQSWRAGFGRQVLALVSLVAGVICMGIIG